MFETPKGIESKTSCPVCGKPTRPLPDRAGRDAGFEPHGARCENPDPLKSAIARRWIDGSLKPPS